MTRAAHLGVACLLVSGVLMLYARPLSAMVSLWNVSPMYSYAFTVPLISLFILWSRREDFRRRQPAPARRAGGAVLAAALVLVVLGEAATVQVVQQFSFLVAVVGLVVFLFGLGYLKIAAPALAYLLFMIPFWDTFTEPLHWPFQNNSAQLGVAMLHAAGIPAYREGTVIALSNITIEVARACSGVNYLIAVLALALPLSYLRLRGTWRRLALISSALAIAGLANGLRVALIGALAYLEIGSPLHGPFHVLHGLFVAGVGYFALFAGLHLLESSQGAAAAGDAVQAPRVSPSWRMGDAFGLALVFWTLAFVGLSPRSVPVALAMPLDDLPSQLGAWQADRLRVEGPAGVAAWNDADWQLRRRYYGPGGQAATVDVWYFEAQQQSREIVSFRVAGLHQHAVSRRIRPATGLPFSANVVRLPEEIGLFWYVLDGTPEADQYVAKLRSLWTALSRGHSNGAAIMLRAPSPAPPDEHTLASMEDLAAEVHVALGRHWHPAPPGSRPGASTSPAR